MRACGEYGVSWIGRREPCLRAGTGICRPRRSRGSLCPKAAVRAMPARLLLLCLLFRSSWLTVEGDRHVGAAGVLHRRGGRAAVAVSVGVAGGVPYEQSRRLRLAASRLPQVAQRSSTWSAVRALLFLRSSSRAETGAPRSKQPSRVLALRPSNRSREGGSRSDIPTAVATRVLFRQYFSECHAQVFLRVMQVRQPCGLGGVAGIKPGCFVGEDHAVVVCCPGENLTCGLNRIEQLVSADGALGFWYLLAQSCSPFVVRRYRQRCGIGGPLSVTSRVARCRLAGRCSHSALGADIVRRADHTSHRRHLGLSIPLPFRATSSSGGRHSLFSAKRKQLASRTPRLV